MDVNRISHELRRQERVDQLLHDDGANERDDGSQRARRDADDESKPAACFAKRGSRTPSLPESENRPPSFRKAGGFAFSLRRS